jgi:hypothetical protein
MWRAAAFGAVAPHPAEVHLRINTVFTPGRDIAMAPQRNLPKSSPVTELPTFRGVKGIEQPIRSFPFGLLHAVRLRCEKCHRIVEIRVAQLDPEDKNALLDVWKRCKFCNNSSFAFANERPEEQYSSP